MTAFSLIYCFNIREMFSQLLDLHSQFFPDELIERKADRFLKFLNHPALKEGDFVDFLAFL